MTMATTTMSVDNDACSNIWATNQSLYDIPLSPLSLILGTWSLSNLNPNWLLSLESPSNWADFESSRDDPSKVWRTLALSSAILGTWSLSPPEPPPLDNAWSRITHHRGWISKKPQWGTLSDRVSGRGTEPAGDQQQEQHHIFSTKTQHASVDYCSGISLEFSRPLEGCVSHFWDCPKLCIKLFRKT